MSNLRSHLITVVAIALASSLGRLSAQTPPQSSSIEAPVCRNTLMRPRILKDPANEWDLDLGLVTGTKEQPHDEATVGVVDAYVAGDNLALTSATLPSLSRTRNIPNTKVHSVVFDGRQVNVDMPLVFDSANVTFYAQTLRIGPRGSIVFTAVPSGVDQVTIVVDTLDISAAPSHPFVFVTRGKKWPGTTKRLVTVIANRITQREPDNKPVDNNALIASLTLDPDYAFVEKGKLSRAE